MLTISIFLFLSLRAKLVVLILTLLCKETSMGTPLAVQWLRFHLPVQELWVQSLVRELRSHMPRGAVQKKKNTQQNRNICRNTDYTNYSRFILPITRIPLNDELGIFRKKIKQGSPGRENKRGV